MIKNFQRFFEGLIPFCILGISIVLVVGLVIMFSYLMFWGFIIGLVLWLIFSIKRLLFSKFHQQKIPPRSKGRIIEHNDKD